MVRDVTTWGLAIKLTIATLNELVMLVTGGGLGSPRISRLCVRQGCGARQFEKPSHFHAHVWLWAAVAPLGVVSANCQISIPSKVS